MTEKTLYIELFQPFAQYRNPFTFYYAQTYPLPPKSTIIGMFQNLVDDYYGHKHGVENWWKLKISIHGGFESVFWNYQQLIKGDVTLAKYRGKVTLWNQNLPLYSEGIKSQRTPVYQQELFNEHLFIFVKGNEDLIEIIKSGLENPKKVLYLGRSEDVIFLKNEPKILEDEGVKPQVKSVKRSLWLKYPTYIKLSKKNDNCKSEDKFPIKNDKFPVYSIPVMVKFRNNRRTIRNKAEFNKNTEREVEFETVIYTGYDYVVYLEKEIKIERYKIDDKRVFKIPTDYGWLL